MREIVLFNLFFEFFKNSLFRDVTQIYVHMCIYIYIYTHTHTHTCVRTRTRIYIAITFKLPLFPEFEYFPFYSRTHSSMTLE